jgi:copper(I)-binding protein
MSRFLLLAVLLGAAAPASAHPGHGADGLAAGFGHPFLGLDHLLAMAAVGVWAAFLGRRLILLAPLSFMSAMALGAGAALAGLPFPGVELATAGSLVVLGVLIAGAFRLPGALCAALVAGFGFAHGHAHGAELPLSAQPALYAAGFLIATGLLHGLGATAALFAIDLRRRGLLRAAGVAVAAVGLWLAAAPAFAAGGIEVQDAWARASASAHKTGAAYLTLVNRGDAVDRLVSASTPAAERAEVHAHLHEGGIMRMRKVDGVDVHPGEPVVFAPGGLHVMLMGLTKPLDEGARFPLTLHFEKAGDLTVQVAVLGVGAAGPAHDAPHRTH